ncbi:hypothetical protein BJ165DRAFT_633509 [Panaeolus papilionaceus]|nr:hypothetical protein BJ165DRAFT_633509 [Panaeolus papilionaceus]
MENWTWLMRSPITGRAVGFEMGVYGPPERIPVALLDQNPLTTPTTAPHVSPNSSLINSITSSKQCRLVNQLPRLVTHQDSAHSLHGSGLQRRKDRLHASHLQSRFFKANHHPLFSQLQFSHLVKSKPGCSMTSAFSFLLDYLVTMTRSAQASTEFGRTKIVAITSLKGTNSEDILVFNRQRQGSSFTLCYTKCDLGIPTTANLWRSITLGPSCICRPWFQSSLPSLLFSIFSPVVHVRTSSTRRTYHHRGHHHLHHDVHPFDHHSLLNCPHDLPQGLYAGSLKPRSTL